MSGLGYAQLRKRWEAVCGNRRREMEADIYRRERLRRPSGPATVAALRGMLAQTGDDRFSAAIEAIIEHGLDQQDAGTSKRMLGIEDAYVRRMLMLTSAHRLSIRNAAARVAVEYWVAGESFYAVVKRLERAYRRLTQ
jgi:hypothetical protein